MATLMRALVPPDSVLACVGGKSLHVTASFGVAIGHGGARHWQQLFAAADAAMYRAKAEGRNCVREAQSEEGVPAA
ncbi:diguanylate cyclase domain-containing protein [Cupriavidus oxalaticus]|uniref:diguanylate cyclase domain-containing protein n=2 Tax=Cupriavidus TaxID=106589 RepID=UPI001F0FE3D2|nr:diguanylate cyclase [Cupriavidus oxalaticus]